MHFVSACLVTNHKEECFLLSVFCENILAQWYAMHPFIFNT